MARQLIMLEGMATAQASIACGTLVTFDDDTAKRYLESNAARGLMKHEPTPEQLSGSVSLDTSEKPAPSKKRSNKEAD
jgi:hypothetical protein